MRSPRSLAPLVMLLAAACGASSPSEPSRAPVSDATAGCTTLEGAWSRPVEGLRGRLVRSAGDALQVRVELENVGPTPLSLHWDGRPSAGFVTFELADAAGVEIPEPEWRLGGNEPGGSLRLDLAASATARFDVGAGFTTFDGRPILRIGAFWGRELPADGAPRFLRGHIVARAARPDDSVVTESGAVPEVTGDSDAPAPEAWIQQLALPPLCIE